MAKLVNIDKYLKNNPMPVWSFKKDYETNATAERNWLQALSEAIRADNGAGVGGVIGEVVDWPRADGLASYIVVKDKPLQLAHLALGDGYTIEAALIRGLVLDDIVEMVERERRWKSLAKSQEEKLAALNR